MSGVSSLQRQTVRLISRRFCRRDFLQRPAAVSRHDTTVGTDNNLKQQSPQLQQMRGITSYVVLLPEVPSDSPETNAIMRLDQLPAFSEITPIDCVNGVAKLSIEFETELSLHTERLTQMPNTFESVVICKNQSINQSIQSITHLAQQPFTLCIHRGKDALFWL